MNNPTTAKVTDQYPEWFITFLQNVQDMRDAQNKYFSQPTKVKLSIAKAKEQKVDIFLSNAIKKGLITHAVTVTPQQPQMF